MLRSTMSVLGIFNVRPDIFDKFHLPNGVEMDVLEPELLSEVAELESLYTDPDVLKSLIGAWSSRRLYVWSKLYETTQFEYNPIWNKDGTYDEIRDLSGKDKQTRDLANTAEGEALHSVYAYNSGNENPAEKDHSETSGTDTGTIDGERSENEKITRREYGNIGVTSTQKLIEEERNISDFDIYNYIITDFKHRFCVMVY